MKLPERSVTVLFALTSFVSAALLFSVQPMIAKLLLPLLGGTSNVWNTCMLFFQAVLLAGYGYAVVISNQTFQRQVLFQLLLLAAALTVLPIGLSQSWIDSVPRAGNPSLWLLGCLAVLVGLPFLIVSSNAPLLQKWFAQASTTSGRDPYFLYSASNAGSFLALISYPVLLEPNFTLRSQSLIWTAGYILLLLSVAICGLVAWTARRTGTSVVKVKSESASSAEKIIDGGQSEAIDFKQRLRWVFLAFVPSSLMLGVTTFISTDIASVPLLWVIPLSLYLLSFVLAFARRPLIPLRKLVTLLPLATLVIVFSSLLEIPLNAKIVMVGHLIYFFLAALTCHQQLAAERPSTTHLTEFYFWLSVGGVLGGVFNALMAPMIFKAIVEYPLIILAACLLLRSPVRDQTRRALLLDFLIPAGVLVIALAMFWVLYSLGQTWNARMLMAIAAPLALLVRQRPVRFALSLGAILLVGGIAMSVSHNTILSERNFFGVLRVTSDPTEQIHWLFHGSTNHGRQSTKPERKCEALSYFHRDGPVGPIFATFRLSPAIKKVAIIGLGTGATAVYAQPDQQWTFYEINPAVIDIAQNPEYFSYLTQCTSAPMNMVLGDARLRIREASDGSYGLIVLDAFSSDAIPLHLITQQALDLYLSKLAPRGMLVFHISNRHLDLSPVMSDLAASRALYSIGFYDAAPYDMQGKETSVWVVMAREREDTGSLANNSFARVLTSDGTRKVWTDDFSNILSVMRWR